MPLKHSKIGLAVVGVDPLHFDLEALADLPSRPHRH